MGRDQKRGGQKLTHKPKGKKEWAGLLRQPAGNRTRGARCARGTVNWSELIATSSREDCKRAVPAKNRMGKLVNSNKTKKRVKRGGAER